MIMFRRACIESQGTFYCCLSKCSLVTYSNQTKRRWDVRVFLGVDGLQWNLLGQLFETMYIVKSAIQIN